ncbi:MAG: apolipoprotein N-acyltransferase [Candidatus Eisenbacteria bacterium]|nr:apolipoprotein N-acyltransferase [Candidatus Eisenbacteria bacterium]
MTAQPVKRGGDRPGTLRNALGRIVFWLPSVLAAGLLWAAFPPVRFPTGIFLAWLPLLILIEESLIPAPPSQRQRGLWRRIWAAGFLFYAGLLYWILHLSNEQVTIPGLMIPSLVLMAGYSACFFVLLAALLRWTALRTGWSLGLLLPIFWPLVEWLRSIGPLGFPWGSPGYALARFATALQITAWTGFWGLHLWIGLVTGLLFFSLQRARKRGMLRGAALRYLVAALLVVLAPLGFGVGRLVRAPSPADALAGDGSVATAIIQPNVIREVKWRPGGARASLERLRRNSREALDEGAELLVWPETALPMRLLDQPLYLKRVAGLLEEGGAPLLTGTLHADYDSAGNVVRSHNSAILLRPGGELDGLYHKRKLVPFSERMPLQKILPFLTMIDFGQSDFFPGRTWPLFEAGSLRMAPLICFESVFPDVSRRFVDEGASVLVNITNDFWFGDTPGPIQHADMAIHRAVETGLPLVRCANTGVSFFVDPYGRIVRRLGTFREGYLLAEVAPGRPSFAMRHGPWLLYLLGGIAGGLVLASGVLEIRAWRRRRHG